jgi:DNA repair exonuclease SbcCD ATPase subunit
MFPFYELWSNDLTSVLLLLLLVYAQVQYHLAAATAKIAKQTRALRVSATEENNKMLNKMRDDLQSLTTRIESKENLEQRLQTLASAFKELVSAESALLTSKVATLKKRLVSGGFWVDKARQKLQTQMDDASQRNALLENAASMV